MNKQQKEAMIADLKQLMTSSQGTFLINYKGMNVPLLQTLRKNIRAEGGQVKVTKATLMRLAAQDIAGSDGFAENFKEQVGLVFATNDVSAIAKKLVAYAKENESLRVIAGFYQNKMLNKQELTVLATLPSREVLLGQLAGTLQAPMATLARQLNQMVARLAYVLKAIEEQKQQVG
jgi:large subunit ribosomal protein L10